MRQSPTIPFSEGDLSTPAARRPARPQVPSGDRSPEWGKVAVGQVQVSRNGRGGKSEASPRPHSDDADARYAAALKLVQVIDHNLQKGTRHYYDTQGRLLNTLDEVIHALLADSLALDKPDRHPQGEEIVEWARVSELAV